jgi:hypothetical protein
MSPEAEDSQRHSHAHAHGSDHTADSAGFPWAGRSFEANPFAGDDGSADPTLISAIERFRAGEASVVEVTPHSPRR